MCNYIVTAHTFDHFREHHPEATHLDIRESIQNGKKLDLATYRMLTARRNSSNLETPEKKLARKGKSPRVSLGKKKGRRRLNPKWVTSSPAPKYHIDTDTPEDSHILSRDAQGVFIITKEGIVITYIRLLRAAAERLRSS